MPDSVPSGKEPEGSAKKEFRRYIMEALGILGFVFGMMGIVALVRLEKLIKTLKSKGILEQGYKKE